MQIANCKLQIANCKFEETSGDQVASQLSGPRVPPNLQFAICNLQFAIFVLGMTSEQDLYWMQRALTLAERGRGHVEPNPLVGAVVVRDGQIVGEGWHEGFGQAHAEANALAGADARRATLYVTLEPCCHHGKTAPCTAAVITAGIRRVVAALQDPYSEVSGRGAAALRAAGVEVEIGTAENEARCQNAPYLKLITTGRPFVHAKWAMTLDGKIATKAGDSHWISNEKSRRYVHELRGRMDAIVIGAGTARADDPLLTARPPGPRQAMRIVVTRRGDLDCESQLVRTARETPVLIATQAAANATQVARLQAAGCEVLVFPTTGDTETIDQLLAELGRRRLTNVLVEGGPGLLGGFFDARAIDEVSVFIAPLLIGGRTAPSPIGGTGVESILRGCRLEDLGVERFDADVLVRGRTAYGDLAPVTHPAS